MTRLIILFVILAVWAIVNVIKAKRHSDAGKPDNGGDGRNRGRKSVPGKKYSWTWMQAAGSMNLKFIRPELSDGYPAISGTVDGISVMVQAVPPTGSAPESMVFRFHFPEPAGLGLELKTVEKPDELPEKDEPNQAGTVLLAKLLEKRPAGAYFMRITKPDIFSSCINANDLDHIARLSLIYRKVILSDSELQVHADGINNDLQSFREQLATLLGIAGSFARFARMAADRKKMTVRVPKELAEAEKVGKTSVNHSELQPVRTETPEAEPSPEPVETEEPETLETETEPTPEPVETEEIHDQEKTAEDIRVQDQESFLHQLWQKGISAGEQKKLFEPCVGREVEWEGILKMSYSYSTDFVFGKEGGVKATFELAEFKPEGSFMPIRIKAVAAFPKTEMVKFDRASGKKFRFRGTLLKIEPIAREIYLSRGSITGVLS